MVERYDSNIHASFKRSIHICINAHSAPFTSYIQVPLAVMLLNIANQIYFFKNSVQKVSNTFAFFLTNLLIPTGLIIEI